MTIQVGFNPSETLTSAERLASGKGWAAGSIARDQLGYEWLFVQASAAIPQYQVIRVLASANQAAPFTSAGVSGTAGAVKCYAISASASIASGSYGWVMAKGTAAVKCPASATGTYVPTGQLYACASAQPGLVSSTATTTHFALIGLTVAATATTSTTASTIPVVFFDGIAMTTVEA